MDSEFSVDVSDVKSDRINRDIHFVRDQFVTEPISESANDLPFLLRWFFRRIQSVKVSSLMYETEIRRNLTQKFQNFYRRRRRAPDLLHSARLPVVLTLSRYQCESLATPASRDSGTLAGG
jgi:hypothetical protein